MTRMWRRSMFLLAILTVPVLAGRPADSADRRLPILRRCVLRIEQVGFQAVRHIRHDTLRSLHAIHRLTEAGKEDEAAAVAERGKAAVWQTAREGVSQINAIARECEAMLTEAGAPDEAIQLIHRVETATKEFVVSAYNRAVQTIDNAIGG